MHFGNEFIPRLLFYLTFLIFSQKFNFSYLLVVSKRFGYKENAIELYAERVPFRGLSAVAQAEGLRVKLLSGLALRRYLIGTKLNLYYCFRLNYDRFLVRV